MKIQYYGQDQIDKWLVEHCVLPEKGVIVDVGAGDGINMSNSKHFEDKGWVAVCMDGDPRVAEDLKKNRRHGEQAIISNKQSEGISFYKSKISPDISGLIKYNDDVEEVKNVSTVKLEDILHKYKIGEIDILSIDTEGTEIDVFESMDFEKHKPTYLVIEFNTQSRINFNIEPYFTAKGYKTIGIVGPNIIFEYPKILKRDQRLIVYGSSLSDQNRQEKIRTEMMAWAKERFSWSNVARQWDEEFKKPVTKNLDQQVEELLDDNQALKAWELVKNTSWPKKERLWLRVKHAFDYKSYVEYYSKQLEEHPVKEEIAFNCDLLAPRFAWVIPEILKEKPNSVLDLGCADGYLSLTLANSGIKCVGVNLYKPSIDIATKRANDRKLPTEFICDDIFNYKKKHDVVVLMEILEHLPDPQKAIDHAMSLVTNGGSLFISTPRTDHIGVEQHKRNINRGTWDDGKPTGHLRLFTEQELKGLLSKYKIKQFMVDADRCMCVEVMKKEETGNSDMLESKAIELILKDEPIKALGLLPKNSLLKKRLLKKLDHIFNYKNYVKKYAEDPMKWRPQMVDYDRHFWILKQIKDAKSLIDLGCYEGSLVLKAAKVGKRSVGVEICKEAVKHATNTAKSMYQDAVFVQADVISYKDKNKYDAVCALELIEHVPDPVKLIKTMLRLVSHRGWCYLSTPNGCYDPESTRKVWEDENALIDHVRTFNRESLSELLKDKEFIIEEHGKELYAKFRNKTIFNK